MITLFSVVIKFRSCFFNLNSDLSNVMDWFKFNSLKRNLDLFPVLVSRPKSCLSIDSTRPAVFVLSSFLYVVYFFRRVF